MRAATTFHEPTLPVARPNSPKWRLVARTPGPAENGWVISERDDRRLADLSARFRRFAEVEARSYSPLYERLSLAIADDRDLLALAANGGPGQPPPNLFLGAVHYLLMCGVESDLRRFYPSLAGAGLQHGDPLPDFRRFCRENDAAIVALLRSRRVQTNEVGRSACLMPAFAHVASLGNGPIGLVEIGASAGLNLLCDRYFYDYGDLGTAGEPAVAGASALRGGGRRAAAGGGRAGDCLSHRRRPRSR